MQRIHVHPFGEVTCRPTATALLCALLGLLSAGWAWAADCVAPPAGLVAWWPGEGNANDIVGTNNGAVLGGISFPAGEVGLGFNFNGVDAGVLVPASSTLDVGAAAGLTIELWINPADASARPVVDWTLLPTYGLHLWANYPNAGALYANLVDTSGVSHIVSSGGGLLASGTFQHLALTYDKASGVAQLFLNGVIVQASTLGTFTPRTGSDLHIGYRPTAQSFDGTMDEVTLYRRALTTAEITTIYNAGSAGKCSGPVITSQPTDQTVAAGDTANFAVTATGTTPLSYQWQFNSTSIAGATSGSLTLTNVQPGQAGSYSVVVSNAYGSVASSNALLTVLTYPPTITSQPDGYQPVWVGWTTTFTVAAAGSPPLNYQWSRSGTNLPGATLTSLTLTSIQLADASTYGVQVSNAYGTTNSEPAILAVFSPDASPVKYVNVSNATPVAPFLTWATAATNIQDTIDVAADGDTVLVTNGLYATGGRVVYGMTTNRVAVDKAVVLQSVNGPEVTVITGQWATRCVYLTNGAVLSGFTLSNGAPNGSLYEDESGGGVWCESNNVMVTNCTITGNHAGPDYNGGSGGGAYGGTLNGCTITGNSGGVGGGASYSMLNNCTIEGNGGVGEGGGAEYCTLNNCTLTGNWAYEQAGGAEYCTLNNCTLTDNESDWGGGAYYCTLNDCTLTGNVGYWPGGGALDCTLNNCTLRNNSSPSESGAGGGACGSTLNNCTLTGNSAAHNNGGGAWLCTLNNCTLTGNSAWMGGGASGGTLNNCILYYNTASIGSNYDDSCTLNYCCTTPLAPGPGNISSEPMFVNLAVGDLHLLPSSPCVNAGLNQDWMTNSTDLDGNPRISCGVADMGVFELNDHPPVVSTLAATTTQNQPLGLATEKLLAHASDPDGHPLAVSAVSTVSTNGGAVVLSAGGVTYTPLSGFAGLDRFSFTVSDGDSQCGTTTADVVVSVIAGDAPSSNMLPAVYAPGSLQVRFAGILGRSYSVQRALAVAGPWVSIGTATVGPTGIGSFEDTTPPPDGAFYRTAYP